MDSRSFRFALTGCTLLAVALVAADDSAITWSGSPKMLKGHPTVSMVSEKIVLTVHLGDNAYTDADCTFLFKNNGPACSVRVGFPDRTRGADEGNFVKSGGNPDFPHPTFQELQNFKSWIDGKPVATSVVLSQDPTVKGATYGGSWHVKVVKFPANGSVTVRDTYRQPQSGGIGAGNIYLNQVQYIMSTGASWNGPIGEAEVDVHLPSVLSAKPIGSLTNQSPYSYEKWDKMEAHQIFYTGFSTPEVSNETLVFKRSNFKPSVASDINIFWPQVIGK